MIWKQLKTIIRTRIIGQDNADRLTQLHNYLSVYKNRWVRNLSGLLNKVNSNPPMERRFSIQGKHTFFGYYDISPFNKNNSRLLAMAAPEIYRTPTKDDEIIIGYFNLNSQGSFHEVGTTKTWCWQQGCRLQWFPGDGGESIIYNRLVDDNYGCVIQNIDTKSLKREYHHPIYDIECKGHWALYLNFSRLQRLRPGYGYVNIPDASQGNPCPSDDGIWLLDMQSGSSDLIITLEFLSRFSPSPSMIKAEHYINHISFNPSGSHFMFFHLWINNKQSFNRLFVCERDGSSPTVLTESGTVSHYTWKSDSELLVTVNYDYESTKYILFNITSRQQSILAQETLTADGHPTYSPDGELLLTDTYPDKYREQHLLLYSEKSGLININQFWLPFKMQGEIRCDLHPRWDHHGKYICFDSAHNQKRDLYVLESTHAAEYNKM